MAGNPLGQSAEVARKLRASAEALEKAQKGGHKIAVDVAKVRIDRAARARTGGDGKFSNVGKAKAVLGHRVKTTQDASTGELSAHFIATGPWGLVDSDYGPWEIRSRLAAITGKGAKRRRRQRDLDIAYGARGLYSGARPLRLGGTGAYRFAVKRKRHTSERVWEGARDDAMRSSRREVTAKGAAAVRKVWT